MKTYEMKIVILVLILSGMSMSNSTLSGLESDQGEISLIATTSIVADTLLELVGESATVSTLMASGVDPHEYEPTPMDLISVNNSDYIFWIGSGVEEGLETILQFWGTQNRAFSLLSAIPQEDLIEGHHDHDDHEEHESEDEEESINPHFWLDPILWSKAVSAMTERLIQLNPADQDLYSANNQSYQIRLDNLHQDLLTTNSQLEESQRFLVTPHASFSYFASRYDFQERSLEGISTDTQAGIQEIDELALYLKEHNISVVFPELTTPSNSLEAVIDAARALGHTVALGEVLSAASLGAQFTNYFELLAYNMDTIVENILNPPEVEGGLLSFNWSYLFILGLIPLWSRFR